MLIECLVYFAVWMIVVGLAFSLFYRVLTETRGLERCADDVVRALKAGERWRADVREATGPIGWTASNDGTGGQLLIPHGDRDILYLCTATNVVRATRPGPVPLPTSPAVHSSRFIREDVAGVTAWRWELELRTRAAEPVVCPRLTFAAVPGSGGRP